MHEIAGLTEVRPGTYVFNDRTTVELGACEWEDCALTVLATVVSTAVSGQAVIDAGSKALGREPVRGAAGEGFGALADRPQVTVRSMSEEHGVLDLSNTTWRPEIGERVQVVPNHVCLPGRATVPRRWGDAPRSLLRVAVRGHGPLCLQQGRGGRRGLDRQTSRRGRARPLPDLGSHPRGRRAPS